MLCFNAGLLTQRHGWRVISSSHSWYMPGSNMWQGCLKLRHTLLLRILTLLGLCAVAGGRCA